MATTTNLGRVGLVLKGDYNAQTAYVKLDVVSYQGSAYAAKGPTTGHVPTDKTYWQPLTDISAALTACSDAASAATAAAGQANEAATKANELVTVVDQLAEDVQRIDWKTGVKKYIVRWDKKTAKCTRLGDAAEITTDTSHFAHKGTVDPQYSNPFDNIYPWSHRKLCKVDRAKYKAIFAAGGDIMEAITMWEDEPGFALGSSVPGMDMVYTPTFWRSCWEDETYVYAGVADGEVQGWEKRPATVGGRYLASLDETGAMTSRAGDIPRTNVAINTMHADAKKDNMTLDDIFTWCDDTILLVVEYATMNTQQAVGDGVSSLYRADENGHPLQAAAASNSVILPTAYKALAIPGAILSISTVRDQATVGKRKVASVKDHTDAAYCVITFEGDPVDVTTAQYWAIHGLANLPDKEIGSKSGFIGTAGKANAYYRGRVSAGNMYHYVLGAYRQQNTSHIWVAKNRKDANDADALDTAKHVDTGCELPTGADGAAAEGYINSLHIVPGYPLAPFCAATGGNSTDPVGDYIWTPAKSNGNTILFAGAIACDGARVGRFCANWGNAASYSWWYNAVLPFLITPWGD